MSEPGEARPPLPAAEVEWIQRTRRHPRPTQPDYFVLRRLVQFISAALGRLEGPLDVLDVFCGTRPYEDLMPAGSRVTGYDIDQRYASADVTGSEFLPFDDASYDLLFFAEGFFYSPNPDAAARELMRVARHGGHVLVTLPLVWEYRRDQLEHRFTAPELAAVFERAGWTEVAATEVGGYSVSWALLSGRILRAVEEHGSARSSTARRLRFLYGGAYLAVNVLAGLADRFERRRWRPDPYVLPPDMLLTARKPE